MCGISVHLTLVFRQLFQYDSVFDFLVSFLRFLYCKNVVGSLQLLDNLVVFLYAGFLVEVYIAKVVIQFYLSQVERALSNYSNLNSCLLTSFTCRAVLGEVSNFTILETCFLIITPLAFFLRETVVFLFLEFLIFSLLLYLASYNSITISVIPSTLSLYVSYVRAEVFLLIVSLLQPVVDACSKLDQRVQCSRLVVVYKAILNVFLKACFEDRSKCRIILIDSSLQLLKFCRIG